MEQLDALMDRAMSATNKAVEQGADLKRKLSSLAEEVEDVRDKLARSQEEARRDALTGLYNRLAFQEELAGLADVVLEDTHAPCVLLVDVDFFKRVNDTHGHGVGDHVLKAVAQEIEVSVRGRDTVARARCAPAARPDARARDRALACGRGREWIDHHPSPEDRD